MKTIQAATAAVLLIGAGSIIPAFGQSRNERGDRFEGNNHARLQSSARGDEWRGSGQSFRREEGRPQFQRPQQQGNRQQGSYREEYRPQSDYRGGSQEFRQRDNWQQSYREYRPQNTYRNSGNSYGFPSGGGLRWVDRGGYGGRFIPQSRFNSSFGRRHLFRIGRPLYGNGFARFSYGGYAFRILDPVPTYWGPDWYDSDDVYVDYEDDGYYLHNGSYPGVGIAISIDF